MKKWIPYTTIILLLFLLMYWLNKDAPIQYQWEPTFDTYDKQPFGAYAFDKILNDSWTNIYYHNYYSIYDLALETINDSEDRTGINDDEINDDDYDTDDMESDEYSIEDCDLSEIQPDYNLLIVANYLYLDSTETAFLLKYVEKGGSVILATNKIPDQLQDTLNITVANPIHYKQFMFDLSVKQAEEKVRFCSPDSNQTVLSVPQILVNNYFEISNTTNHTYFDSLYRISTLVDEKTISLRYAIGEGNLILISNPLLFTNYGILNDSINPYIWKHLAYLDGKPLIRTEYYEKGSQGGKSRSKFRVILRERPFKWAYYTTLAGILVFMVFTAKRKQKVIPVIKPPMNKMLDFVRSIAGLYLLKNNNADILLKKQIYWGEELKRKYGIDIVNEQHDYDFYKRVAAKTRQPFDEIRRLFLDLGTINVSTFVSDDEMMRLVSKMNEI